MRHRSINLSRRALLTHIAIGGVLIAGGHALATASPAITVWKDPNCGCCGAWVEHLRRNGFAPTIIETADIQAVKTERGVPAELASCHTAVVAGYTIEGHVPAQSILRLLAEKPVGRGLAVPGIPIGSPGMEGGQPDTYDVILFGSGPFSRFDRFIGDRRL